MSLAQLQHYVLLETSETQNDKQSKIISYKNDRVLVRSES